MTDCAVVWGTWARYHLVPILNTKPVAELKRAPSILLRWCEMMTLPGKRLPALRTGRW